MAELHDNLAGLRVLYQDLSAVSDDSIPKIDRLCIELEAHIEDFRKLLDKPAKNNTSRQTVLSGTLWRIPFGFLLGCRLTLHGII